MNASDSDWHEHGALMDSLEVEAMPDRTFCRAVSELSVKEIEIEALLAAPEGFGDDVPVNLDLHARTRRGFDLGRRDQKDVDRAPSGWQLAVQPARGLSVCRRSGSQGSLRGAGRWWLPGLTRQGLNESPSLRLRRLLEERDVQESKRSALFADARVHLEDPEWEGWTLCGERLRPPRGETVGLLCALSASGANSTRRCYALSRFPRMRSMRSRPHSTVALPALSALSYSFFFTHARSGCLSNS